MSRRTIPASLTCPMLWSIRYIRLSRSITSGDGPKIPRSNITVERRYVEQTANTTLKLQHILFCAPPPAHTGWSCETYDPRVFGCATAALLCVSRQGVRSLSRGNLSKECMPKCVLCFECVPFPHFASVFWPSEGGGCLCAGAAPAARSNSIKKAPTNLLPFFSLLKLRCVSAFCHVPFHRREHLTIHQVQIVIRSLWVHSGPTFVVTVSQRSSFVFVGWESILLKHFSAWEQGFVLCLLDF
ncbi:hypothetical protein TRVL_07698 [Trypanosoma vivax]|nr:hypothetical protein TRVL_07698 [Trypanosoma vivax]